MGDIHWLWRGIAFGFNSSPSSQNHQSRSPVSQLAFPPLLFHFIALVLLNRETPYPISCYYLDEGMNAPERCTHDPTSFIQSIYLSSVGLVRECVCVKVAGGSMDFERYERRRWRRHTPSLSLSLSHRLSASTLLLQFLV